MNELNMEEVCQFVNENIVCFHRKRCNSLSTLNLNKLIQKNPYLFKAKNINKASALIENFLEAFLSSSEEKIFGDFLEALAIFVSQKTTGGHKSASQGVDLEFQDNNKYYVVSIKSGPNWGNSSQHAKLAQDLRDAEKRLRQSNHVAAVEKVLGICYGKTKTVITDDGYLKVVGQNFWTLISGNPNLYVEIVEPIGFRAREHNEHYYQEKDRITNMLTEKFISSYCDKDKNIDWEKLVKANSGNYDLEKFL